MIRGWGRRARRSRPYLRSRSGRDGEFEPEEAAAGSFGEFGAGGAALGFDEVFYDGEAEAVAFSAAGRAPRAKAGLR